VSDDFQPQYAVRRAIEGNCGHCDAAALAAYEVLAEEGWLTVIKCVQCLTSVRREHWNRYGYIDRDSFEASTTR